MGDLATMLPTIVPKAAEWTETQSALILKNGFTLTKFGINDARSVDVAYPEKIRVVFVTSLPVPEDEDLRVTAIGAGLLGPGMIGITLGYGILVAQGHETRRLLSHAF